MEADHRHSGRCWKFGRILSSLGLGALTDLRGSYGAGLLCFASLITISVGVLLEFGVHWMPCWTAAALERVAAFGYRPVRRRQLEEISSTPEAGQACG